MRDSGVPSIIAEAGEQAMAAYRAFLDDPKWRLGTRRVYGAQARRFFRWAESHSLTLETITTTDVTVYTSTIKATMASNSATNVLTAVRALFRHFVSASVLAGDPCAAPQLSDSEQPRPTFAKPLVPLEELKAAVHELGDWEEDSKFFQAGLAVLAPVAIGTMDPAAVAAFTGVPAPLVREFAARLLASGVWRPDGRLDVWGAESDTGAMSLGDLEITEVFFDVCIAVGHPPRLDDEP